MVAVIRHLSQVPNEPVSHKTTEEAVTAFLADLEQAGRSPQTRRAYAGDLRRLIEAAPPLLADLDAPTLRAFFAQHSALAPASRARRQAAVAAFTRWAYREGLLEADPMGRVARVRLDPPLPRGLTPAEVERLLAAIPTEKLRDRVLVLLLATTGLRVGEALALHVEDVSLTRDDERLAVLGKGGKRRTVLLDDPRLLRLLRRYLRESGYVRGPLFRAERGVPATALRYQSFHPRFAAYAATAGLTASPHDLRHAHAQALVNDGVSLATIRKRLGHANVNTTLRYAEQADAPADAELRTRQRRLSQ